MHKEFEIQPDANETYPKAAVDFLSRSGNGVETVAAELGVHPEALKSWRKKFGTPCKSLRPASSIAQLRAENEALRNEILQLQVQWDILKTTLGMLSTTVCSRGYA